jgi:FkbM family methyltransferase
MTGLTRAMLRDPRLGRLLRQLAGRILHKADVHLAKETIGTSYGSHTVLLGALNERSIVYSFGVGEDASFDLGIVERYSCEVHAFDPTPRSRSWAQRHIRHPLIRFRPVGLAARDGTIDFAAPDNSRNVSFSRADSTRDDQDTVRLHVRSLPSIMRDLDHDRIDLLKMDIEGFEYEVLDALHATDIRPKQIAVEFHHGMYGYTADATNRAVRALRDAGYGLFHVSDTGREYSFCLLRS